MKMNERMFAVKANAQTVCELRASLRASLRAHHNKQRPLFVSDVGVDALWLR